MAQRKDDGTVSLQEANAQAKAADAASAQVRQDAKRIATAAVNEAFRSPFRPAGMGRTQKSVRAPNIPQGKPDKTDEKNG